jgi:glycerol-3-phosphate acyltransferase PlsY
MNPWLLTLLVAYLLGSIPFGYVLVRIFRHEDIRTTGSGNIGATNVARSGAKGLAIATLLLDLGKGALAVWIAFQIGRHAGMQRTGAFDLAVSAAVAAVLGHVFPVWLRFRGGKGVATALGVFLALAPAAAGCVVMVFAVVFALSRYVSLASILAAAAFPMFAFLLLRHVTPMVLVAFLFLPALIIAKHHANIRRLVAGTESQFGSKKAEKDKKKGDA